MAEGGEHSDRDNTNRRLDDGAFGCSAEMAAQPSLGLCPDPRNRPDSDRGGDSSVPRPDLARASEGSGGRFPLGI